MTWILACPAVLLCAIYFREWFRKPIRKRQSHAPGTLVKLSQGQTHFQWFGPEDGPVIVCVHGLTTPSVVWKDLLEPLAQMGARVLIYDLYGRGYSDRPKGPQTTEFFVRQLKELLTNQQVEGAVTLMGYSMGGAIVPAFAAQNPDQVARMILIAPTGIGHDLGGLCNTAAKSGLLGSWLMHLAYPQHLRKGAEQSASTNPAMVLLQNEELRYRGFIRSVLSSLRGVLNTDMQQMHMAASRLHIKVLTILGRDDPVIPLQGRLLLSRWNPTAEQYVIDNAGHDLTYVNTKEISEILRKWLGPMLRPEE